MTAIDHRVFVFDDLHPEDNAMLQALYSRSPASVVTHLDKVKASGSGKFMDSYYVGYGHASIGDCGTTTVFMENYSMLAAKAIQNNPLYSGQEASTRYLDFSAQPMVDPFHTEETTAILNRWIEIYNHFMPLMKEAIAKEHPFNPNEYKSEKQWAGAVAARAFDTLRGLIPLGCTTLFSWTTNLRQARDHLMKIATHPLPEVREMAIRTFNQIKMKYPHSFNGFELDIENERYAERHDYEKNNALLDHIQDYPSIIRRYQLNTDEQDVIRNGGIITRTSGMDVAGLLRDCKTILTQRPQGSNLPQHLKAYGFATFAFQLDYGGFKDLQRHRGGVSMTIPPLLDGTFGFHSWYLNEYERLLPDNGRELVRAINDQFADIHELKAQGRDPLLLQYFYTHGTSCPVTLSYTLPQVAYVAELRSQKTVHPSIRPLMQQMARWMQETFPGIACYADFEADGWTAKRGDQDIQKKAA